jgi:DNA-binding winged helix-turn-helix (wHTH) protein
MSLASKRIYRFAEFELRVSARVLARDGKPIPLGSKAFEVLTCLVTHAGEVVTKDELLKTVWPESFVEEGNLSQHIFALRKALGDRSGFIVTIPGRGYQFTETVSQREQHGPDIQPELPSEGPGALIIHHVRERAHIVIEESLMPPARATTIRHADRPASRPTRWIVAAIMAAALLAGWAAWIWVHR